MSARGMNALLMASESKAYHRDRYNGCAKLQQENQRRDKLGNSKENRNQTESQSLLVPASAREHASPFIPIQRQEELGGALSVDCPWAAALI